MSEIRLFPIGFVASTNSTSKGAWTSGGTEVNNMFEPNAGCDKDKLGFTAVTPMENRSVFTRKIGEERHAITYKYKGIFNWEFKQIRRFMRDVADYRVNSFYVIDFSSGQKVTALATGANWNASIYDTTDFSATSGEGGNYCCVWYPRRSEFRVGIISSKVEDSSITFPNSSDFGSLQDYKLGEVYAYPMYRVYFSDDKESFNVDTFVDAHLNASFAGPVRSGSVKFTQKDVK